MHTQPPAQSFPPFGNVPHPQPPHQPSHAESGEDDRKRIVRPQPGGGCQDVDDAPHHPLTPSLRLDPAPPSIGRPRPQERDQDVHAHLLRIGHLEGGDSRAEGRQPACPRAKPPLSYEVDQADQCHADADGQRTNRDFALAKQLDPAPQQQIVPRRMNVGARRSDDQAQRTLGHAYAISLVGPQALRGQVGDPQSNGQQHQDSDERAHTPVWQIPSPWPGRVRPFHRLRTASGHYSPLAGSFRHHRRDARPTFCVGTCSVSERANTTRPTQRSIQLSSAGSA